MNKRDTKAFRKTAAKRMNRPERMDAIDNGFYKASNIFYLTSLKTGQ